jgi:hypothetical protein
VPIRTPADRPIPRHQADADHHERLDALEDAEQLAWRRHCLTTAQARHIEAPPQVCEARWGYLLVGVVLGALGVLITVSAAGVTP